MIEFLGDVRHVLLALGGAPCTIFAIFSWLVPDDVVQRCTASGTPEEAKTKVQEYIDAGCTSPILYPLGPDVQLMIDTFSEWE